jgi:hypothetical protein
MKMFKNITLDRNIKIIEIITSIVTIGTLIAIYCQISQVDKSIRGETNSRLYTHEMELFKVVLSDSNYSNVVFNGVVFDSSDSRYNNASTVVALFADLLEHIALQKENLEGEVWEAWRNWIIDSIKNSPMLMEHFRKNSAYYSLEILELVKQARK